MRTRIAGSWESRLPPDDDHPYRTGAWRPNLVEYDADDLDVVEGRIPPDLAGVYLRNTENPIGPSLGRYHPFDGDGMLHAIHFAGGAASYRNRLVRTAGLAAELEAGEPLFAGIIDQPARSLRDGWGARGRMKDASSTDVVVHAGRALSTFYQCGDAYAHDPATLEPRGTLPFSPWGISAHPKLDEHTGELLWFSYAKEAPYLRFGVLDAAGAAVHEMPVPLPGPRLPHDMAFTERFAIFNDLPLFWEPALLAQGVHKPRFYPELPSRFAVVPRRGGEVRWFDAAPTYVLHFSNAYEDGDEIVLDGFYQTAPSGSLDMNALGCRLHRWRFDLRTGRTREEPLGDLCCEFPAVNGRFGGRAYRYLVAATGKPGWFLFDGLVRHDLHTGAVARFPLPDGVFASEAAIAPRGTAEDDAWIVTFVSDTLRDLSECWILDAAHLGDGPIARIALPERICAGTHACWAPDQRMV